MRSYTQDTAPAIGHQSELEYRLEYRAVCDVSRGTCGLVGRPNTGKYHLIASAILAFDLKSEPIATPRLLTLAYSPICTVNVYQLS